MEPVWLPEYYQVILLLPRRRMEESLGKVSSLRKDLKIMPSGAHSKEAQLDHSLTKLIVNNNNSLLESKASGFF